jgi:dTDP-4-dehydrorhamnose reductase
MILVTGGTGQLAGALAAAAPARVVRIGRPEFDFDQLQSIAPLFERIAPSAVVNAAAYTAVDKAESEPDAAMRANRDGPALLARLCAAASIPFIHISTDYVFDGLKGAPYVETDATNPTGVYGASKLAGELAVLAANPRTVILRTSWVYAATGKNFVLTMLNAAKKTRHLRVVADQRGCPTTAADLAQAVLGVLARVEAGWQDAYAGVTHAAGSGWTTWHGLACAAFEEAGRRGLPPPEVTAICTADWPTPARRPTDSRLDCTRLAEVFGVRLPDWRSSLTRVIDDVALA